MSTPTPDDPVGRRLEVEVGPVAHGGHCVARHEGRVLFVRHTLPGERVVVEVTGVGSKGRYLRADAVEVRVASPDRVTPPCPLVGECGGCDWQHASLPAQRALKAAVVQEQLQRLAGLERSVTVEELPGAPDGLGWRTRVRYAVDEDGRLGFRRARSHDVVPVATCPLAHPAIQQADVTGRRWAGVESVEVRVDADQTVSVTPHPRSRVGEPGHERAAGRLWQVSTDGFWQVHPAAAEALVGAVAEQLDAQPGEHLLDLFSGVGLFAGALADRLGVGGRVDAVEASRSAVQDAQLNLADLTTVHHHLDRVDRFLARSPLRHCDLVVLDPPRAGVGRLVVERVARLRPRAVSYVACDPASLARDLATFQELGYRVDTLRAFDLFPMTQHVEVVAGLVRKDGPAR